MPTAATINISLNGKRRSVTVPDNTEPLLYTLRNRCDQQGPKFACGVSQCGACTVLVAGVETRSCVVPVSAIAQGAEITTLDGLARGERRGGDDDEVRLHPLQKAFIAEQAAQCAFCMNGMVMGALAWLNRRFAAGKKAVPTADEVRLFLSGKADSTNVYICRCGAHARVVRAIQRAAKEMAR